MTNQEIIDRRNELKAKERVAVPKQIMTEQTCHKKGNNRGTHIYHTGRS